MISPGSTQNRTGGRPTAGDRGQTRIVLTERRSATSPVRRRKLSWTSRGRGRTWRLSRIRITGFDVDCGRRRRCFECSRAGGRPRLSRESFPLVSVSVAAAAVRPRGASRSRVQRYRMARGGAPDRAARAPLGAKNKRSFCGERERPFCLGGAAQRIGGPAAGLAPQRFGAASHRADEQSDAGAGRRGASLASLEKRSAP